VIANYDDVGKTTITQNTVYPVLSPEAAGNLFGFGFAAHRLVRALWRGSQGVPTYVIPVDNDAAGAAATGTITYTATSATAGNVYLYIAGDLVTIPVAKGDAATDIGDTTETKVNADTNLPVTAVNALGVVTFTAKDLNAESNNIPIKVNLVAGQETAEGVTTAIVQMTGGLGTMLNDMATALKVLGEGDQQNADFYTELVHGFGDDSAVLDDISEYNGEGNDTVGNWSKTVHRPFRTLCGDILADAAGLTAAKALGNGRKTLDRTNGQISVPGSANNPNEIAATVLGLMARFNQDDPNRNLNGTAIPGVFGGVGTDDWTRDYDSRNDAVLAGISPTQVVGGAVIIQNVLTFYHPDSVSRASNGYKSQFSISKIRYVIHNNWVNFNNERWKGVTIVDDITKVGNAVAKLKVKDTKAVLGELVALTGLYESDAVIYQAQWTIDKLIAEPTRIVLRAGTDGWDINYPILLSGEANIIDEKTEFGPDQAQRRIDEKNDGANQDG
jgi:phage tail sheath gpL-like